MNEKLRQAIEAIQKLPDDDQTAIANRLLDELSEREWKEIVSKPHVINKLRELGRKAMQEESEEGGFGGD